MSERLLFVSYRLSEDNDLSSLDIAENAKEANKVMDKVYKEYKRQLSQGGAGNLTEVCHF